MAAPVSSLGSLPNWTGEDCSADQGVGFQKLELSCSQSEPILWYRYGGAFMAADYGTGELPQAFCRVAAVAGTVPASPIVEEIKAATSLLLSTGRLDSSV